MILNAAGRWSIVEIAARLIARHGRVGDDDLAPAA